jgi:hypothetical protein
MQMDSWNNAFIAEAWGFESIGYYGRIDRVVPHLEVQNGEYLRQLCIQDCNKLRWPLLTLTGAIREPPFPKIGNRIQVVFSDDNILLRKRGSQVEFRLQQCEYDPVGDLLHITAQELIKDSAV